LLANMLAQQAPALGSDGRITVVLAEETRSMANKIHKMVEGALFEEQDIDYEKVKNIAFNVNNLALNCAIESNRLDWQGKATAVCADDIRNLAHEVALLFEKNAGVAYSTPALIPKNRITSFDRGQGFICLDIGGVYVTELLVNIKEVCVGISPTATHINLRGMEIPFIDGRKLLGKTQDISTYVVLNTPWAEQNKTYAVAANVIHLFYSPIGIPVDVAADVPLAEYVRECWESEGDVPFLFMDWPNMACK